MKHESGQSLSAFTAVVVFALFLVVGLVVDGGAQLAAAGRAESVAGAAVRVALDAAAEGRVGGDSGAAAALRAAEAYLAGQDGVTGSVTMAGDGAVTVRTHVGVRTVFLSLVGITTLQAEGQASGGLRP